MKLRIRSKIQRDKSLLPWEIVFVSCYADLVFCPSRMTGKSLVVYTHSYKYYLISPKSLNSITMVTVITTHTFINTIL
jgi:hypothetical protein